MSAADVAESVRESVRTLTAELYRKVAEAPGNAVLSPYSVAAAVGMTLVGARGETAEQIGQVLHTSADQAAGLGELGNTLTSVGQTDADVRLDIANSVWAQQGLTWDQQFLSTLETGYKAALQQTDFRSAASDAAGRINGWVAEQTHDKITQLISPGMLDDLTRLVLVNAAYFKAAWAQPFRGRTVDRPFRTADQETIKVPTMSETLRRVGRRISDGWQAVQLDFVGDRMAMALVLPDGDIADLEQSLDGSLMAELLEPYDPIGSLQVQLPKWSFRTKQTLNDQLAALGMPLAFDRGRADFGGMTGDEPLAIDTVVQEAYVAVDEQGAEAAAATGVAIVTRAAVARPETLIFDRPFLFVIFDRQTRVPVFIGRVSDPRQS